MANTFKLKTSSGAATPAGTAITLFTATTKTVLVGLSIANLISNSITIHIQLDSTTAGNTPSVYIGKNLPIPSGSALNALTGKIVLDVNDVLKITASSDNSVDLTLSYMEIT
tara:strand:+ start:976 stop:1311 length:336 start_codon:yes stop_codon:yes gene_type:complete